MGLIKSTNAPAQLRAFSMHDIETQARAILAAATQKANQVILSAQQEAEKLKTDAQTRGFADGRQEGLAKGIEEGKKTGHQQALNEHRAALADLVKSLKQSLSEIDSSRRRLESEAVTEVVELATAIARRVTKRQGLIDPGVLAANISEAMKLVVHSTDVRLAVHPSQMQTLKNELPRLQLDWPNLEHVELIEDAALTPGSCRIFTRQGHIDGELDVQLDRVIADLLPASEEMVG